MGRMPEDKLSFFKFLVTENYDTQLRLPTFFVNRNISILPKNAKLKISSGETWDVRLEKMDDDEYYFTQGWNKFIQDMKVHLLEVLVFWFNPDMSTFDVLSYGLNGCVNELVSHSTPLSFTMVLKYYQESRLILPRRFFEASGLIYRNTVTLEYFPTGRTRVVKLDHRTPIRSDLALGWGAFRKENDIVIGNTYSFEFNPRKNVILVKYVSGVDKTRSMGIESAAWSDEEEEETKPDISRLNRFVDGVAGGSTSVDKGKRVAEETPDTIINNKRSKSRIPNEDGSELYFELHHLMEYQRKRLAFPQNFMLASGLNNKFSVKLEYLPTHGRQVVRLNHTQRYRTLTSTGWREFVKANGIVINRSYSFEVNRDKNVIQVNDLKNVHNCSGSGKTRSRAHVVEYDTTSSDEETDVSSPNTSSDDSDYETSNNENEFSDDKARDDIDSKRSKIEESPRKVKSENEDDDYIINRYGEGCSSVTRTWRFSRELRAIHFSDRLSIPISFAKGTGIAKNRYIKLLDGKRKKWPITITDRNLGTFAMTAGWRDFLAGNNVVVGDTILFEYVQNPDNIVEATVLKSSTKK